MDGNDSLKRVQRREAAPLDSGKGDAPMIGKPNERKDERTIGAGYYISREKVDRWNREFVLEWLKEHQNGNDIVSIILPLFDLLILTVFV
jgi:hypothetical protein